MTVGIMGLGYVGLPLAVAFAEAGERVVAVDIDAGKVAALLAGESYVEDVPSRCLRAICDGIEPTTRVAELALCGAIVVCVPTPLTRNREPDLAALAAATRAVAEVLHPGQLVVYESTSYPGTVRERALPILEESGLDALCRQGHRRERDQCSEQRLMHTDPPRGFHVPQVTLKTCAS